MKIIKHIDVMKQYIKEIKHPSTTIGFVPTMGYLHEGHLSLMKKARDECDFVITSIFVNPTQFGPGEDYEQYPRDFQRDVSLARENGVDVLFMPLTSEMYPKDQPANTLTVTQRTNVLCGKKRPGHFDGVVTVLTKLFHIVQPDRVYFGQKDAQQVAVVEDLISTFFFPIELVTCPTVRHSDGLAKSSRNVNLFEQERVEAANLFTALQSAKEAAQAGATVSEVRSQLRSQLNQLTCGKLEYVEILSYPELQPTESFNQKIIIALAYQFEKARLIDNIILDRIASSSLERSVS